MGRLIVKEIMILTCAALLCGCGADSMPTWSDGADQQESTLQEPASDTQIIGAETAAPVLIRLDADTSVLDESYRISNMLYGIFLEDINFAVDGGLYAEMVKNRSFEYGVLASGANKHGWSVTDREVISFETVDGTEDGSCIHANNPVYALVTNQSEALGGITNTGFLDGMAVKAGNPCRFSAFIRGVDGYSASVMVRLFDRQGTVYAEETIDSVTSDWHRYELELTPTETVTSGLSLGVYIDRGTVALDMVSLFPGDTWMGRSNGLRKDLVEYLAALSPSFLRFPGGCAVEGRDEGSMYSWKDSIGNGEQLVINGVETTGDVAVRPQAVDIWRGSSANPYYMTYGLGFYEYFLLCEDLNCLPVPVLNAGMTCPVQSGKYQVYGLNSEEFASCVQDALDLVEFCRGGADTRWGSVRIAMGHEEPFSLHYVGIGNEQWQEEYYSHYQKFKEAFENAALESPELFEGIELIVANGPSSGDRFAWNRIGKDRDYAGLVDEHYYESPAWLRSNTDRYDSYDRASVPVFLGEYAGKSNSMEAALAEAAFMTGLERNSDIVKLSCYAPLFGSEVESQWSPDLIWFNNHQVYGSANYYVQKLFMNNAAKIRLPAEISGVTLSNGLAGKVGLGTWRTSAKFDDLMVVSNSTGETLLEEHFDEEAVPCEIIAGRFALKDGFFEQTSTGAPKFESTGDVAYFGDTKWQDYTMTVKAVKTGGLEGFLIPVAVQDRDNNIFWNVGGWNNTVSCLQLVSSGAKSGQLEGTVSSCTLQKDKEYELKVEVTKEQIKCYIDDKLVVDYTQKPSGNIYQASSVGEDGSLIIKLVNVTGSQVPVNIEIDHFEGFEETGVLQTAAGASAASYNSLQDPEAVTIVEREIEVGEAFSLDMLPYAVSVIRIPKDD